MSKKLVLMRHGQSEWNLENRFTGWHDSPLTKKGKADAKQAGKLLVENDLRPEVVHTSVLSRAVETTTLALEAFADGDKNQIDIKQSWKLNERHYGDLTGKNKNEAVQEFGEEQVFAWRRKYLIRPPEITPDNIYGQKIAENHKGILDEASLPKAECLGDVTERLLPYFEEAIKPDLTNHPVVLISAHGNSLRALIKYLDNISNEEISSLNLPTAIPLVYDLNDDFMPADKKEIHKRYLGDTQAALDAADKVAKQTNQSN